MGKTKGSGGAPKFSMRSVPEIKTLEELRWVTEHPLFHRTPACDFIEYRIDKLTREMQEHLLSRVDEVKQRRMQGYHMIRIEDDVGDGLYPEIGTPMHLDYAGNTISGRHRLVAFIRGHFEPRNIVLIVLTEPWMSDYVDINIKERSLADVIVLMGHRRFSALVLRPLLYEASHWKINRQSILRQAHLLLKRPELLNFGDEMFNVLMNVYGRGSVGGLLAGAVACARVDLDGARKYFTHAYREEPCIDGRYCPEMKELQRVVHFCVSKITSLPGCASFPKQGDRLVRLSADFAIRCWNAHRTGEPLVLREDEPLVPRAIDMAVPV